MKLIQTIFVLTLAALLLGGVVFVAGQSVSLVLGQGEWLTFLNYSLKDPMCIAASICAIAGFLLSYKRHQKQSQPEEARSR
ncbi:cbb3-type cytochrome oxidase subunit 3 [Pseudarthrobacter sp. PvP004]|uniref:hypothetical protein n=1 Tax=Pseudarthrobacter sp. PvP004 TaxID=2817850 RepID=UPI001AE43AA0|nr:hypothetical protein [Pseudarthrobacter sp. PvP004]MBP2266135.1 cbb3-type cytochrome oxidase subunit 3 [Pseudarthrobacter sp. PvP004]